jgi:hypothetical protein
MPTERIITPEFRASWVALFRPVAGKANPGAALKEPEYSIRAVFPPTADLSKLKEQAGIAATEKWAVLPKSLNSPFRRNDELDNPIEGIGDDWIIMTFTAKKDKFSAKSHLVDAHNNGIMDETEVYSGAWFKAQVQSYAYDTAGNKGVSFGLRNVQMTRDDDPIGGGNGPANKAFEPVGGGGGKAAGSLFD